MNKGNPTPTRFSRITKFVENLFRTDGAHPAPAIASRDSLSGFERTDDSKSVAESWKVYNDRKSVYNDIQRMLAQDEFVDRAADIVADNATAFDLVTNKRQTFVTDDEQVREKLEQCSLRLNMEEDIWQTARDCWTFGGVFRENVIERRPGSEGSMYVKLSKQTIPYQIWPNINSKGDKIPGWYYKTDQDLANNSPGQLMEEWQITPFLFGSKKGYLPTPPLAVARRNWNRLALLEDGMAIARHMRAYDKYVHRVPVEKSWTDDMVRHTLRTYKDLINKRRVASNAQMSQSENPLTVQTDFFLPDDGSNRGGVESLSSANNQLTNLTDMYYHRERFLAVIAVPITYMQIMSTQKTHLRAAGSSISDAEKQFNLMNRRLQATVRRGAKRTYDLDLILSGIIPIPGLYDVRLSHINTLDLKADADIELTLSQAACYFVEAFGALPPEIIASKFFKLSPEQQEIMTAFLNVDAKKILTARVKHIENEAVKPSPGSGNANKSRASRSTEQGFVFEDNEERITMAQAVDLFGTLVDMVNGDLAQAGVASYQIGEDSIASIRQNLADIAIAGQPLDSFLKTR